jgi:mRNA interferase RelE/StbE
MKGYWKLRVGDYRVVYEIVSATVKVYGIGHRSTIYDKVGKRL